MTTHGFESAVEREAWRQEMGTDPESASFEALQAWRLARHARFAAQPCAHPTLPTARGAGMHTDMASTRRARRR